LQERKETVSLAQNMNRKRTKISKTAITLITISVCVLCVTTAWATLSFVKQADVIAPVAQVQDVPIRSLSASAQEQPRARAPEPSTLLLFGSGILGMIAGFVRRTYIALKRAFDVVASIIGIIFLSPLFIIFSLLIKLTSKGPIFYNQTRVGKDGELFEMYKFRTMRVDAEQGTGPVWAAENDPRLIPVGKILRKTHVDEIPQFINILKGEMSLIGPRPERPVFVDKFKEIIPNYTKRLAVKPGITGLAQVWHRYDETIEDVKKKIKYDLLYIKKYCLWTDLRILFRTFRVVFTGEGAR
jgi:exopolysaccharide biosynthesis polyprenyl glycosylphosphotransferase